MNRKLILSIAIGNALVPLNSTMLVVALPAIARDAGADLAAASWLITTYLIAMAALQPIGGRLGDRFGRRRLMLGALLYFGIASVGAALSVGLVPLAFFRLQQALAGALIVPNGLGILRRAAGERAGMHFGLTGAMSGAGATLGPLVGGLLTAIDWRLVFLVNVPVVALAFVLARSTIPEERARPETKFDVAGVVFLGVLLTAAAWLLTSLGRGAPDGATAGLAVAVVIGAILFIRYELAQPDAALPPALFRIRAFTAANGAIAFANLSLYATLLAVPALLAADASTTVLVGVALTALSAAMVVLGPATGWLVDRFGARWPPALGGMLIVVGCLATGAVITHAQFPLLLASLLVIGAGVSLTFPATRVAAVDAVPARYVALASGVVSTSRYFGGMLGAIIAGIALATNDPSNAPTLFGVLAASGALVSLASLGMPGSAHVSEGVEVA